MSAASITKFLLANEGLSRETPWTVLDSMGVSIQQQAKGRRTFNKNKKNKKKENKKKEKKEKKEKTI